MYLPMVLIMFNRHRWTGRYEAHLWDNSFKKEGHSRKGRQGLVLFYFIIL